MVCLAQRQHPAPASSLLWLNLLAVQAGWIIPFFWTVGEEHWPLYGLSSQSSLASPQA